MYVYIPFKIIVLLIRYKIISTLNIYDTIRSRSTKYDIKWLGGVLYDTELQKVMISEILSSLYIVFYNMKWFIY